MTLLMTENVWSDGTRHATMINLAFVIHASPVTPNSGLTYVELVGGASFRIPVSFDGLCRRLGAEQLGDTDGLARDAARILSEHGLHLSSPEEPDTGRVRALEEALAAAYEAGLARVLLPPIDRS